MEISKTEIASEEMCYEKDKKNTLLFKNKAIIQNQFIIVQNDKK